MLSEYDEAMKDFLDNIWFDYDKDHSGFLEESEFKEFIK